MAQEGTGPSAGPGTTLHISGELFKMKAGVDMAHVPYRGSAAAYPDIIAGRVHMIFDNIPGALAQAREGRVRALGVTSAARSPVVPDAPSIAETLPGYDMASWTCLCGPAGMPRAAIERMSAFARRDLEGYFWFIGRADDVINTAGHLVGPFEVESALIEHPAVAEAGVIGKPDPVAMEVVKAFVALKDGYEASDQLRRELIGFSREKLGSGVAPREIDFVDSLPKTRSGKIMRRLLKARELGLPEGDTSTLERE